MGHHTHYIHFICQNVQTLVATWIGHVAYVDDMEEYVDVSKNIPPCQPYLSKNIPFDMDKIYFIYLFFLAFVTNAHKLMAHTRELMK
jgi:hypothetical protein